MLVKNTSTEVHEIEKYLQSAANECFIECCGLIDSSLMTNKKLVIILSGPRMWEEHHNSKASGEVWSRSGRSMFG